MFLFRQHDSETVYGALFDISSGSVGVGIVASNQNDKFPRLVYSHRVTMRVTKHGYQKTENIRRVREALFSASLLLSQEGRRILSEYDEHAKISKMYVTCSSPWSYVLARNVYYENDEPVKISHSIINDLVESAESEILSHLEQTSELTEKGFKIVEKATVDFTINDYPVKSPIGLTGKTISLSHIAGLIPEEILEAVTEVRDKLFAGTEFLPHTYMLVMYCIIREIFPRLNSICIIDVSGEATEFAIIENGLLVENSFIPHGTNTFIRDVMEKADKPATDIQSYMKFADNESHLTNADFAEHIKTFGENISNGISKIQERRLLPLDIVTTVQHPYGSFFAPIIEKSLKQSLGKQPHIIPIKKNVVEDVLSELGNDVYLALSARFFHKSHDCTGVDYE